MANIRPAGVSLFQSAVKVVPRPEASTSTPISPVPPPNPVSPVSADPLSGKTLEYEQHFLRPGDEWTVSLLDRDKSNALLARVLLKIKEVTSESSELELSLIDKDPGYDTQITCRQDAWKSISRADDVIDRPKAGQTNSLREITADPITFNMSKKWDIVVFEGDLPNFCFRGNNETLSGLKDPADSKSELVSENILSVGLSKVPRK